MKKILGIFIVLFAGPSWATDAVQAIFEMAAKVTVPTYANAVLCEGIRHGWQPAYRCGTLAADAQIEVRAICDGIFWGSQRAQSCANIVYKTTQKVEEQVARDLCLSLYWGRLEPFSCDQLARAGETDPLKLRAKEVCQGVYVAPKGWQSCAVLTAARARSVCENFRRWTPAHSLCRL